MFSIESESSGAVTGDSANLTSGVGAVSPEDTLAAIQNMKIDFSSKFENMLSAVDNVSKEIKECTACISQAKIRISDNDDSVSALYTTSALKEKVKSLTAKVVAQEGHGRRNNLRLINLPEGAEGKGACSFLEQWLPEALDMGPLCSRSSSKGLIELPVGSDQLHLH